MALNPVWWFDIAIIKFLRTKRTAAQTLTSIKTCNRISKQFCFIRGSQKHYIRLCTAEYLFSENRDWRHLNILRPRQNGRHFADDICKGIFLNENVWIPIKISGSN